MKTGKTALLLALMSTMTIAGCAAKAQPDADTEQRQQETQKNEQKKDEQKKNQNQTDTASDSQEEADDDIELSGLSRVDGETIDLSSADGGLLIEKGGSYKVSGSMNAPLVIDAGSESVILDFGDVSIENPDGPAVFIRNAGNVNLVLSKKTSLTSTKHAAYEALNAALYSRAELKISGEGSLKISDPAGHAIKCKEDLTIDADSLDLEAGQDGIHASDSLDITKGSLKISAGDEGMEANGSIRIENGTFDITSKGDGIRAEKELTLSDGTFTIQSENEGLESKDALTISGGTYKIHSADDGINAAGSLTISGGNVRIVSETNDGIDSNGDLILSGGTVESVGLRAAEGAFDTDNTPFVIRGGTIIGLSASATRPTQSDQNTVMIQTAQSFDKLELVQNGKTLISWTAPSDAQSQNAVITLSCPQLQAGVQAELKLGGTTIETFDVSEGLTTVGNIREMGGGPGMGGRGGQMPESGQMPDLEGQTPPEGFNEENGMQPPALPEYESGTQSGPQRPERRGQEDAQSSMTA